LDKDLPDDVMSHRLLELMIFLLLIVLLQFFTRRVHLMVRRTIKLICGIDKVQYKFDKYLHDIHVQDPITKEYMDRIFYHFLICSFLCKGKNE
jgi:hypothetical protein